MPFFDPCDRFGSAPAQGFRARLEALNSRISLICREVGRDPADVKLLPVTKTVPAEILRHAFDAGMRDFAENKIQEARDKSEKLGDLPLRWSVVGHLQTNKVKHMVQFASAFHALDSLRLAAELERQLSREGRRLDVYVQINTSGEASKYGLAPEEMIGFIRELGEFEHLRPRGLMTLALFSADRERVQACFVKLRELRDRALQLNPDISGLSMGMSGDYEDAIREGATVVRVGQAIFGSRPTPDEHYWPGAAPVASADLPSAMRQSSPPGPS